MRKIHSDTIIKSIAQLAFDVNCNLAEDAVCSLKESYEKETGLARDVLGEIVQNISIAKEGKIPLCQDTGMANVFIKMGNNIIVEPMPLNAAINEGVRQGYVEHYLRKSIIRDPLRGGNTGDNTPANIYIEITEGENLEITFLAKGGGSENAGALKMLKPSDGWTGIKDFVLEAARENIANACPPVIVGLGIGGDFAKVGLLAKTALLRSIGSRNNDEYYAQKEQELFSLINETKIGAMGLGGSTTALAVFINAAPTHIASLPVAVNFLCHSARRKTIII